MKTLVILLLMVALSSFLPRQGNATVYNSNGSAANVQSIHDAQAQNGDTITLPAGTFTWSTRVRITKSITLRGAGIGQTKISGGSLLDVTFAGGQQPIRITGIEFTPSSNMTFDTAIGVVDHCKFNFNSTCIFVYDGYWNGDPLGKGDYSWAAPTGFGTDQFLFFEDCVMNNTNGSKQPFIDTFSGGRWVVRHCSLLNAATLNGHGTESSQRLRGMRAVEIYNNTWVGNDGNNFMSLMRSGVLLWHDDTLSHWSPRGFGPAKMTLYNFRLSSGDQPWGAADGANPWDINDPTIYYSGTVASSSGLNITVQGSPNWTTGRWQDQYSVRKTGYPTGYTGSMITANGSNTLTFDSGHDGNTSFSAGDQIQIRKVIQCLDCVGRARGSLIRGQSPTPPPNWNDQVTEPCYSWNNRDEFGNNINWTGGNIETIRQGEHYFRDTPMPGYTPYVYPHPLVTNGSGSSGASRATVSDFNGDGHPDFVLQNSNTNQTAIWYLNNNFYIGGAYGPTLVAGWGLRAVSDFNGDSHPDYALFAPSTNQTALWYLSGPSFIGSAYGPTLPNGWELVGTADFNGDGKPDYVLYNASTRQTAIWYLNNNVVIGSGYGPTLPPGWNLIGVADFDGDGHPDYAAIYSSTGQTAIGYLSGLTLVGVAAGPVVPAGWAFVATGDFNGDGKPDYLLYNSSTHQTAIWYLNNNVFIGSAYGPTVPSGWSLVGQ